MFVFPTDKVVSPSLTPVFAVEHYQDVRLSSRWSISGVSPLVRLVQSPVNVTVSLSVNVCANGNNCTVNVTFSMACLQGAAA